MSFAKIDFGSSARRMCPVKLFRSSGAKTTCWLSFFRVSSADINEEQVSLSVAVYRLATTPDSQCRPTSMGTTLVPQHRLRRKRVAGRFRPEERTKHQVVGATGCGNPFVSYHCWRTDL